MGSGGIRAAANSSNEFPCNGTTRRADTDTDTDTDTDRQFKGSRVLLLPKERSEEPEEQKDTSLDSLSRVKRWKEGGEGSERTDGPDQSGGDRFLQEPFRVLLHSNEGGEINMRRS